MRQCHSPSNRWSVSYRNGYRKNVMWCMVGWRCFSHFLHAAHYYKWLWQTVAVNGQHHTLSLQELFNDKNEGLLPVLLHLLISESDKSCVTILCGTFGHFKFAVDLKKNDIKTWLEIYKLCPLLHLNDDL